MRPIAPWRARHGTDLHRAAEARGVVGWPCKACQEQAGRGRLSVRLHSRRVERAVAQNAARPQRSAQHQVRAADRDHFYAVAQRQGCKSAAMFGRAAAALLPDIARRSGGAEGGSFQASLQQLQAPPTGRAWGRLLKASVMGLQWRKSGRPAKLCRVGLIFTGTPCRPPGLISVGYG